MCLGGDGTRAPREEQEKGGGADCGEADCGGMQLCRGRRLVDFGVDRLPFS